MDGITDFLGGHVKSQGMSCKRRHPAGRRQTGLGGCMGTEEDAGIVPDRAQRDRLEQQAWMTFLKPGTSVKTAKYGCMSSAGDIPEKTEWIAA